jgi:hypothetical protein
MSQHLLHTFLDIIAYNIAELLEESEAEKEADVKRKIFYETPTHCTLKGKRASFGKYTNNLKFRADGIYSYGAKVIELDWERRTAKRLGKWFPTISKHPERAMHKLIETWSFEDS